jgi:hypothetical protein
MLAHDAQQAKGVRDDHNKRLADCDWTQLADVSSQDGFPWEVV